MVQHIILQEQEYQSDSYDQFKAAWYRRQLNYLASDLLETGLSPSEITSAVRRAVVACRTSGEEVLQHFQPVYTQHAKGVIQDCKLSKLGYGLVLLNANVKNEIVARLQVKLLNG